MEVFNIFLLSEDKLNILAKELGLSQEDVIKQSLRVFVERKLKEIKAEIYTITAKYNITSIEEFEELYRKGKIEERSSFEDYKKLDHLEFKREELEKILKELT